VSNLAPWVSQIHPQTQQHKEGTGKNDGKTLVKDSGTGSGPPGTIFMKIRTGKSMWPLWKGFLFTVLTSRGDECRRDPNW
jgi:hypothetical protein